MTFSVWKFPILLRKWNHLDDSLFIFHLNICISKYSTLSVEFVWFWRQFFANVCYSVFHLLFIFTWKEEYIICYVFLYRVAQRSLDTRGNTLNVEWQVTSAPLCTVNTEKYFKEKLSILVKSVGPTYVIIFSEQMPDVYSFLSPKPEATWANSCR